MGIIESFKSAVQGHLDKQKEEREMMERMQKEVQIQKLQIFEEEYKKNALEVAKRQALQEAAEKSGLKKLQAINRARRLNESGPAPGSFFEKLRDYTQKNKAKREENLNRTAELRDVAKKMREERMNRKPLSNSMWK